MKWVFSHSFSWLQINRINNNDKPLEHTRESLSTRNDEGKLFRINIDSFHANISFLYSLKTSENILFSGILKGYRNRRLA